MEMTTSIPHISILHIILSLRPTNGQYNEHCLPLMNKRDITICTYFKSEIKPPEEITLFDGDSSIKGFLKALRTALRDNDYDIIHVHTPHAGILLLMTLLLSGLYMKLIPISVHTVQNSYRSFQFRHKLMFIPGFAFFRNLVFCSFASYESFPLFFKWLAGKKAHVVQNAVDIERIDGILKAQQKYDNDNFTILTVGLIKIKNPFTILEAFIQGNASDCKLIYLGEGNLRKFLTHKIEESDLQKQIKLTGLVPRDRVFENYASADLFISASYGEGLPVAVLEAMACYCPVILSDIPPHREIAEGNDFIPLIKPDDVEGFAREIKKYREMSAAEREMIGKKCRNIVEDRFSLPVMHLAYKDIYAQITGDQISAPPERIKVYS